MDDVRLNDVVAYLQLVRDELPLFSIVDDVLGEEDGSSILERLFGCRRIVSEEPIQCDTEINIHRNWETHACLLDLKLLAPRMPVTPDVVAAAILDEMEKQAVRLRPLGFSREEAAEYEKLLAIRNEEAAREDWQLFTLQGSPVIGLVLQSIRERFVSPRNESDQLI